MADVVAPSIRFHVLGALDLRGARDEEIRAVLVQPKRVALLAYLVLAKPPRLHRRDALVALFWPDSDVARARLALRQSLHFLRHELGEGVIVGRGAEEVGMAPSGLWCDAVAFDKALEEGRYRDGFELYRGDLLGGFFPGAVSPELEEWLEGERSRLRGRAAVAAWQLCEDAGQSGRLTDAATYGRRAVSLAPDDEGAFRRLVALLERLGDRAGVLREYDQFARRLKQEFDAEPAAETRTLIKAVRARETVNGHFDYTARSSSLAAVISQNGSARPAHLNGQQQPSLTRVSSGSTRWRWSRGWIAAGLLLGALVVSPSNRSPTFRSQDWAEESRVARRFYEEGLSAYGRGEWRNAYRLFSAALSEDSTFAMAAYYAGLSIRPFSVDSQFMLLARAQQIAARAPERERLIITHARYLHDPAVRSAVTDSLTSRFPNEPEGHLAMASARIAAGDFAGAVPYARYVIDMDSIGLNGTASVCRACDAFAILLTAYAAMGTEALSAVEHSAREWIARQPQGASPWLMLAGVLNSRGRGGEALQALQRASQLQPRLAQMYEHPSTTPALIFARAVIDGEDYRGAEEALRDRSRFSERDREAIWWLVTSLRNQGRIVEAMKLVRETEVRISSEARSDAFHKVEAQLLFELGQYREAAEQFEALMRPDALNPADPGYYEVSFTAVHAATAWAAAGNIQRLAALADTIRSIAPLSSHGLAWRLPHHARGLLLEARGEPSRALEELRSAIYSPTLGYTRTNLELARVLLSLGRAEEAIPILREALGGSADGPSYYLTRTEVHEWLARAFEAAGQTDSAVVHYRSVAKAWRDGDAAYRARAQSALRAITILRRSMNKPRSDASTDAS